MVSFQIPKQLRHLFAYICCFCQPSSPLELWNSFKPYFIEDLLQFHDDLSAEQLALNDINTIPKANGLSCLKIGLPTNNNDLPVPTNPMISSIQDLQEQASQMYTMLNSEQKN